MASWTIYKSSTFKRRYVWSDKATGNPIPIDGVMQMVLRVNGAITLILASGEAPNSNGSQLRILDAAAGSFEFVITDHDTQLLAKSRSGLIDYTGHLSYRDPAGQTKRLYNWKVSVLD